MSEGAEAALGGKISAKKIRDALRARRKRDKLRAPVNASPEFLRYLSRRELHRREAAHDPNRFYEYVFTTPEGRPFIQSTMHREWQYLLDRHRRLIIIAPRLHGKTVAVAIGRPLYHLGRDINHRIKILCQSDAKAVKRLQEIREHVTTNDYLHGVFPHLHPDRLLEENKHQLRFERPITAKDPSVDVGGITSSASGDRATILIADDVVDRRNAITLPKVREQIKGAWDDWMNLLPPDGRLWYIATLWSTQDLTHKLMARPSYSVAWYEINLQDFSSYVRLPDGSERRSDEPLWTPDEGGMWSKEALQARKDDIGSRAFARGFSNRPMADEEQRVDPDWIEYWAEPPNKDWPLVIGLDTATTQKSTSDWTGIVVAAIHPGIVSGQQLPATLKSTIKIVDAWHARLSFPRKVDLVKKTVRQYRAAGLEVDRVVIERAAGGIELAEALEEVTTVPLMGVTPRNKKEDRFDRVLPYLERGFVEFNPLLHPQRPQITEERGDPISEIVSFPLGTKDIADAYVHVVRFSMVVYPGFRDAPLIDGDEPKYVAPTARVMTF